MSTRVDKLSLVRFDSNDYSVPVRYAHHEVAVKGSVDRVRVCRKDQVLAVHDRLWDKEEIAFEPLHYLELLERKPGALDQAKPLAEWSLPVNKRLERADNQHPGASLLNRHPLHIFSAAAKLTVTELCGRLPDQSALMGVLEQLHDCAISVISVECVDAI